jgi:asparagine synthase (glutamine-hydrolysing)
MCGICGIINFNQRVVQESAIREMMRIMKHRGPDDEGVFIDENVGLGFVRLSIIDLTATGHQPMYSHDERYIVVYNGEIYNYLELRDELKSLGISFKTNSDTEVLLAAYKEWGEKCLHKFNGMWAFVIFDRKTKTIFASRDRYGIKPLYYYFIDDFFAFASEIPPLLSLLSGKPKPDYQSIFDYLVFNRTDQTERTFFEEIRKLQHGCLLIIENNKHQSTTINNKFSIRRWYNLRERVPSTEGFSNPSEFRELFSSAVGLRLRSDVPVGVCLSGGLDSSSIVSVLLNDHHKKGLNTFSAVYKKGQYGDETEYIKVYRSFLNNMFFTTPDGESLVSDLEQFVKAHGEPIPSTGPYAQYKVMELAQKNVVVILDGQGADEEMAGYHYFFGFFFKDLLKHGRIMNLSSELFHYLFKHRSFYGINSFFYFLLPEKIRTKVRVKEKGYLNRDFVESYHGGNSISGNLYGASSLNEALLDHFEYKLEHLLKWEDRNSMWFSLESRVPFLDFRLVEKILATKSDLIIKKGQTKHILRESMKGIVPEKIRLRQDKIGFGTPQNEWFKSDQWKDLIRNIITSKSFRGRKLIDTDLALKKYNQHLNGGINISKEIWKWVHLELWFREFIDQN